MTPTVRLPAVAGAFYPAPADELRDAITELLGAVGPPTGHPYPKMIVVPHAGYVYSGVVAAAAYRTVAERPTSHVVLVGPAHYAGVATVAAPAAAAFRTPLGDISVRGPVPPGAEVNANAHRREHSLEVQLPFLQMLYPGCTIMPLLCNRAPYRAVADVLDAALADGDPLLVVSTDLSHYLDYASACDRDRRTAASIVALDADALRRDDACGRTALQAGLELAARRDWQCRMLDLRNSGDTAGPLTGVVGYGAFALGPASAG